MFDPRKENQQQNTNAKSEAPQAEAKVESGTQQKGAGLAARLGLASVSSATGNISELIENVKSISEASHGAKLNFDVFQTPNLALPVIVFSRIVEGKLFYYNLLPQETLQRGAPQREQRVQTAAGEEVISIDFPIHKAWDAVYQNTCRAYLETRYKVKAEDMVSCAFWATPETTKIDDLAYAKLAYNTANSAITSRTSPMPMIGHADLKDANVQLDVFTEFKPGADKRLSDGTLAATDVTVEVVASEKTNKAESQRSYHGEGESILLSSVTVKHDMIYKPNGQMNMAAGPYAMMGPNAQNHHLLVITSSEAMEVNGESLAENPMSHILGMISCAPLACGRNLERIFTTPPAGTISRDLGVLGYEYEPHPQIPFAPKAKKIEYTDLPTDPEAVTFRSFMDSYFVHNSVSLAWDIGLGSRESYSQQVFLGAAKRQKASNDAIIALHDHLLGNHFSRLWKEAGKEWIFRENTVIIHNGTFHDANDAEHDLRWIDYRMAVEAGKENSATAGGPVKQYAESFLPGASEGNDGMVRLHRRRVTFERTQPSAKVTGLSVRLLTDPMYPNIVAKAAAAAGINLNANSLGDSEVASQLAAAFEAGQSVDYGAISSVFNTFNGAQGQANNMYAHMPNQVFWG